MAHHRAPPNLGLADMIAGYFPDDYVGHAIDVGASDGVSCNTTYGLERPRRWTVLSVEPNPEFHPVLTQERVWVEKCACSNFTGSATLHINVKIPEAFSTIGPQPQIEKIEAFAHHENRHTWYDQWQDVEVLVEQVDDLLAKWQFPKLDVLCVDVEGTELDVVRGCDLALWKPKVVVLEAWEDDSHDAYMLSRGYEKAFRLIHNNTWLRSDG